MGRKQTVQLELVRPGDTIEEPPAAPSPEPPAPAKRVRAKPEARRRWRDRVRVWAVWTGAAAAVVGGIAGAYQIDEYLASDRRFMLAPGPDPAVSPNLRLEGIRYAPQDRILRVFAADVGRSIYLLPLAQRRNSLLGIDWVKNAAVLRRWPNGVIVRIVERTPVAFVLLPSAGQMYHTALIDADGAILSMPQRAQFTLPVLLGVRSEQPVATRRERVRQMLQLMGEVRAFSGQISEIDVSDPENVKVIQTVDGRAIRLLLGKQRYLDRLKNFLSHYPEIYKRLPYSTTFDLRLDDRITALEEPGNVR